MQTQIPVTQGSSWPWIRAAGGEKTLSAPLILPSWMDPIPNKPDTTSAIPGHPRCVLALGCWSWLLSSALSFRWANKPDPGSRCSVLLGVHMWNVQRGGNDRKPSTSSTTFMWVLFPGKHFLCLYGLQGAGTARGLWLSAPAAKPDKPWHPTPIKGGFFYYYYYLCLSAFCCHGVFVLWELSSSSFSFLSLLIFSLPKLVTVK